jgi:N-acetylglucosamine-6-phosphate deacetylase
LYIFNACLAAPTNSIADGAILVRDGRIAALGASAEISPPPGVRQIDAQGLCLAPGFLDLQLNGGFGNDFTADPGSIWQVGERLPQYGVTGFLPTIITAPLEVYAAAQAVLRNGPPPGYRGAQPLGLHFEGPFLNPEKKGAHNPAYLRPPNPGEAAGWSAETGVHLVTLAPELPGALELTRLLRARGVVVSAGHSNADFEQAQAAFQAGITCGTHLFNAMPPLGHRSPGLAGALMAESGVAVGVIADGLHIHPSIVKLAWKAKGPQGLILVTDAMAALGMPPGSYPLGDETVQVDGRSARLPDGTLAGSLLTMDAALRNLAAFAGCSLVEALPCLTSTPARLLGLGTKGQLAVGYDADFVLLTPDGQVLMTIVGGKVLYTNI